MNLVIVSLLVFLSVAFTIVAGFHVVAQLCFPHAARVRERLAREFSETPDEVAKTPLFKNLSKVNLDEQRAIHTEHAPKFQANTYLETLLQQANLPYSVRSFLLFANLIGVSVGITVVLLAGPWFGVPAAILGAALPFWYVVGRRNRRRDKMLRQLPSAFDLMARIINAGQSVMQAFHAVADSFDDPISGEFSQCLHEQKLGLRADVTLPAMAVRTGIMEVRIFAMAMLIQQQSGGKLSDVLQRLAEVVRARIRVRRKVQTLTAEGRMQGWTLIVLPFVAFAAMIFVNREYAEQLLQYPVLLAITVAAMCVGHYWIRRIIKIDP